MFATRTNSSSLSLLRCPFCGGDLSADKIDPISGESGYFVLKCYCGRYPVVAGIPVIKKGAIGTANQKAGEVIALIEAGRRVEALRCMIIPPLVAVTPTWIQSLPSTKVMSQLKRVVQHFAGRRWRDRAAAFLMDSENQLSACDLINLYFRNWHAKTIDYYLFRFGQPRHLVALSLASVIQPPKKAILDLACGVGLLTRNLLQRAKDQPVVGVDNNFFALYVAKYWVAPAAEYVCCEGDAWLPFPDGAFSAVFCSDAFQLFVNRAGCIRELRRLSGDDGLISLVSVRNALLNRRLYPGDLSLPPAGYESLVADMPHRLVANREVLARYLEKKGPALARSATMGRLVDEPWLSVVASHREDLFQDHGRFEDWPHAEGRLGLNPLYREEGRDALGNIHYRLTFPSTWYQQENGECRQYEPEAVSINSKVLLDLTHGKRTPEVERLIEQCVVVGMPERYHASPGANSRLAPSLEDEVPFKIPAS